MRRRRGPDRKYSNWATEAAAASVAQLLYFLLRAGLLGGNRDE